MHALSRVKYLSVRLSHVRGLVRAAVAQLGETAAAAAHVPSSSHHPAPPTEPPPTVAWTGAAVNSVKITGVVLREVAMRHIARLNQPVASTALGLRPPHPPPPGSPQAGQSLGAVSIEGFGYLAHQMAQHLRPGLTVQLEGHLRQDRWTDKETGAPRSTHKVVVEWLALVEAAAAVRAEGEAAAMMPPLVVAPSGEMEAGAEAVASAALQPAEAVAAYSAVGGSGSAADAGGGSAAPRVRGMLQSTPSSQRSYAMYQQEGQTFQSIAEERGVKQSTVLT